MKKFCESLREHPVKIINFEKKEMMPLTNEEYQPYLSQIKCHIFKKKPEQKYTNDKIYHKCRGAGYSISNF